MKQMILIIMLMCAMATFSQDVQYVTRGNYVYIEITDDSFTTEGKQQFESFLFHQDYWRMLMEDIPKAQLTEKQLSQLPSCRLMAKFYIDSKGNVKKVLFSGLKNVLQVLPKDAFVKLHKAYKGTKVDLSKLLIEYKLLKPENYIVVGVKVLPSL